MGNAISCSPKKDGRPQGEEPNVDLATEGGLARTAAALKSPRLERPARVKAAYKPLWRFTVSACLL